MQVITSQAISNKRVLLRLDIDVPIEFRVVEDFRLRAALPTLKLCLEHALEVVVLGHIGRPEGKVVPQLSIVPVKKWFADCGFNSYFESGKLKILENLRFDPREEQEDLAFAKELARLGDVFVNEAFAAHNKAVSTTVLPTLMTHAAGLHFAQEVETLLNVRNNPRKPFIAIMGGAKVKDKLPVIKVLAEKADAVLVGGKLIAEIRDKHLELPKNVMVGMLNEDGFDIASQTTQAWGNLISKAALIVWNGPVGKFEDPKYDQTEKLTQMILDSGAEIVIGGGDSIAALSQAGLLEKAEQKAFVSVGGGAMLKLLADGTLPTIEVLQ